MLIAIQRIAEQRIQQAMEEGTFKDLSHWKNKPLPRDEMEHVPADLRMGYRILKNAGYVPEEVALRKEIARTEDLLSHCCDEQQKYSQLKKLNLLRHKLECRMGRPLRLGEDSDYYPRVVETLAGERD